VFGDQAVRQLAADARQGLKGRVEQLLSDEQRRFTELLATEDGARDDAARLRGALAEMDQAREAAAAAEQRPEKRKPARRRPRQGSP